MNVTNLDPASASVAQASQTSGVEAVPDNAKPDGGKEFGASIDAAGQVSQSAAPSVASPYSVAGVFQQQDSLMAKVNDVMAKISTGELKGPAVHIELFNLQLQVQQAGFRVELVSKVIEHGTSGTRTVLQTQA